jgi:hypothetical protein
MEAIDLLVILAVSASAPNVDVVESASPRVFVVHADEQTAESLEKQEGVNLFKSDDTLSEDLTKSLSPAEQLFVAGWQQRHQMRDKKRPGEGLPWDAPGFEPPDARDSQD